MLYRDGIWVTKATSRAYLDKDLAPGREYRYFVTAVKGNARSPQSMTVSVTTPLPTASADFLEEGGLGNTNGVRLRNWSGTPIERRPVTISRIFRQGEIRTFPQARIDGSAVATQADVKSRWPDGSVQHAILSFEVSIATTQWLNVDFIQQVTCTCGATGGGPSISDLLAGAYSFDPVMKITAAGQTYAVSARELIQKGAVRLWVHGPLVTQLIIEDRTPALVYDVAFNGQKALHPMFIATFYRGQRSVKVEYIAENVWATRLQDITYDVALGSGTQPQYSRSGFKHASRTRWRKTLWTENSPGPLHIDHNLAYMVQSKVIPHFDYTIRLNGAALYDAIYTAPPTQCASAGSWESIRGTARADIGGSAQVCTYMAAPGGRADIGVVPLWHIRYLYAMALDTPLVSRLYEAMMANAEVSGLLGTHVRESVVGRRYVTSSPEDAFGRFVSLDARPTLTFKAVWSDAAPEDALARVRVGTTVMPENTGIGPDLAHFPSLAYIPYLLTGDYYLLEELHAAASWTLGLSQYDAWRVRNPHVNGILSDYARGEAWGLRNLAHAAFASPDGSAEKRYFTSRVEVNLAVREGEHGVTTGAFFSPCATRFDRKTEQSAWCYGNQLSTVKDRNPLGFLDGGIGDARYMSSFDTSRVKSAMSMWMWNYMYITLGHIAELGFGNRALLDRHLELMQALITHPDSHMKVLGAYTIPVQDHSGYLQTIRDIREAWLPTAWKQMTGAPFSVYADGLHSYPHIALAAASFMPGPQGLAAWEKLAAAIPTHPFAYNPMWAITPRE
jgi:hypothetical protein